jgi:hypothetical protein
MSRAYQRVFINKSRVTKSCSAKPNEIHSLHLPP